MGLVSLRTSYKDHHSSLRRDFFESNLLKLDPALLTEAGIRCFERFFKTVNTKEGKLIPKRRATLIDDLELVGLDYCWKVVLCSNQEVTNKAIDLLKETFTNLGPRQVEIHEDFIGLCIDRLKASFDTVSVLQTESGAARDQGRIQTALQRLCQVVRVLHEYVSECDGDFQEERTLLPLQRAARGKKDLPRSFLDRFSKVFMAALSPGDLGLICSSLYPCHHNWRTSATPWAAPPPSSPICTAWRRPGGQETPAPQVSYPHPSPLLTLAVPSTGVRPLTAELHRLPPLSAHPLLLPRPDDARGGGAGQAHDCGPPVQGHVTEQPSEDDLALPGLQPGLPGSPRARLCQDPGRHCCLAATATGTATSLLPNFVATPHPQVTDLLQSCPGAPA